MDPISLWNPKKTTSSDDAGIQVIKTVLRPPRNPTKYENISKSQKNQKLRYVPALSYFCIKALVEFPEQIYVMKSIKLKYMKSRSGFDIIRALIPTWNTSSFGFDQVDPRLWAVIIQIYSKLPKSLQIYPISLSDPYLPLLQYIPTTPDFALITILDLRGSKELTDQTIWQLRALHSLCALDASGTALSNTGLHLLGQTLHIGRQGDHRGPWGLRILRLRRCVDVCSDVLNALRPFPLLCAVDLRGTGCLPHDVQRPFSSSNAPSELFDPVSLMTAVDYLHARHASLLPTHRRFNLYAMDDMNNRTPKERPNNASISDAVVTLGPSVGTTRKPYFSVTTTTKATNGVQEQSSSNGCAGISRLAQREASSLIDRYEDGLSSDGESFPDVNPEHDFNRSGSPDLQAVAEVELSREEARVRSALFYQQKDEPCRRGELATTSMVMQRHREGNSNDDPRLMLYRTPPDWRLLGSLNVSKEIVDKKNDALPINRIKARGAVDNLASGMAGRRETALKRIAALQQSSKQRIEAWQSKSAQASNQQHFTPNSDSRLTCKSLQPLSTLKPPKSSDFPRLKIEPPRNKIVTSKRSEPTSVSKESQRGNNKETQGVSTAASKHSLLKRKLSQTGEMCDDPTKKGSSLKTPKGTVSAKFDWQTWSRGP